MDSKDQPFKCDRCSTEYTDLDIYLNHMKIKHHDDQDPLRPCPECGKQLRKHNYDKHLKIHFGERKFKCTECEMTFLFANNLKVCKNLFSILLHKLRIRNIFLSISETHVHPYGRTQFPLHKM